MRRKEPNLNNSPTRPGRPGIAIAIAALAIVVIAAAFYATRPRPIFEIATTFCTVPSWKGRILYPHPHYVWISNTEVLILPQMDTVPQDTHTYTASYRPAGVPNIATRYRFDVPTDAGGETLAPDGKSMAITYPDYPNMSVPTIVESAIGMYRLDGNGATKVVLPAADRTSESRDLVWTNDSAEILYVSGSKPPSIVRVRVRRNAKGVLELSRGSTPIILTTVPIAGVDTPALFGVTPRNTLLIGKSDPIGDVRAFYGGAPPPAGQTVRPATIVEISLTDPPTVLHSYSPNTPPGFGYGYIAVSPDGTRLLWAGICAHAASRIEARLHRYLHFIKGDTTIFERGWVSNLDGSNLREIGYYELPHGANSNLAPTDPWIIDAKWTPDGKRISFVYKDRVMTAPAE